MQRPTTYHPAVAAVDPLEKLDARWRSSLSKDIVRYTGVNDRTHSVHFLHDQIASPLLTSKWIARPLP